MTSPERLDRLRRAAYRALEAPFRGANVLRDEDGYLFDVAENLLPGVDYYAVLGDFERGAGNEAKRKLRAPWSSAALAANAFGPWRRDPSALPLEGGRFDRFEFEVQCPTGLRGTPPHLDAVATRGDVVVAIESKCCEILSVKRPSFAPAYESIGDERAASPWFAVIDAARRDPARFELLDVAQLVKHYLGLARQFRDVPVVLMYLYWEPPDWHAHRAFRTHRDEIDAFGEAVDGDAHVAFRAASYDTIWSAWQTAAAAPWVADHLGRLRNRYSRPIGPFLEDS